MIEGLQNIAVTNQEDHELLAYINAYLIDTRNGMYLT
jgi:hypothetical protein